MYNQINQPVKPYLSKLPAISFYTGILMLLFSCNNSPVEHYGFIAQLGNDTVSVESVTRQGNTVTSDEVDRFPGVRLRHTVIELNEDGSIRHLDMTIHTPSEPPEQRERKVTVDVTDKEVHIVKKDGSGTVKRDFTTGGGMVEAHLPQMYSLYELYFAAALQQAQKQNIADGTPVQMRQFYIDREFDHFPLGRGRVTALGNGKAAITHDWLSGTGEATMDSGYRMLSYSGNRTTYKVQVSRLASPPDVKAIADRFEAQENKNGNVQSLSVRDTTHAQIGNAVFTVDYGRPLLRGRKLLGDVLPYDYVWRTGANAAIQFTTSIPVEIAGMQVPAGTYTLWTLPHTNSVDLIVNKQTGQWGTEYNRSKNLGMAKMTSETLTKPVEEFTISIVPIDGFNGTLVLEWGLFRWTAPIIIK